MCPDPRTKDATCPRCNRRTELVYVHSHWQCTSCGQVVHDCCDGGDSSACVPDDNEQPS
jgi:ribosomal protein L37AE/L43A